MRWIVDVSSLEGAQQPPHSYCVEAESWQGALQSTRRIRGDDSRMAGFSIDITNDGCKAVDPAKKLRYEVRRTGDATPLTPGAEAPPPSKRRVSGSPPRPASSTPAPAPVIIPAPAKTVSGAAVTSPQAGAAVTSPQAGAAVTSPQAGAPDATVRMNAIDVANVPLVETPTAPMPKSAPVIIPPIVVSREQEPTTDVPLTYREYGFALAPSTTEDAAAIALVQQLTRIQGVLAAAPPGKLVNLAAFDQIFQGRPPVLPLATLTWKDWKPEPAIAFPRRGRAKPVASSPPPAVAPTHVAPSVPAPAPVIAAPVVAAPAVAAAPVVAAPAPAPVAAKPVSVPPPAPVLTPHVLEFPAPSEQVAKSQPPVSQTREKPPVPKRRVRGDELISVLFESMHDLHFLRDSIEGGDFCLHLALEKLPSRIGVVYLYDIDRREFVIVCVLGSAPPGIVGKRFAETETMLASAMRKRRAILLSAGEIAEHAAVIGGAESLLLAPVMQAGRFLGAIELADPSDSVAFSELDANAITYMAEQYAEFVAARGVILDRERSSQPPAVRTH